MNDAVDQDRLVQILLLYGTMSRRGFAAESPAPNNLVDSNAEWRSTETLTMLSVRCKVNAILRTSRNPDDTEARTHPL